VVSVTNTHWQACQRFRARFGELRAPPREEVSALRLRTSRRLRALTAGLLACAAVVAAGLVVGATPAQAATCATEGHAYLTQPGKVYFSGYNGDTRFGVPRITATQGELFRLGGNGINPYPINGRADITWSAIGPGGFIDSCPACATTAASGLETTASSTRKAPSR
jgi:hypothetical protein